MTYNDCSDTVIQSLWEKKSPLLISAVAGRQIARKLQRLPVVYNALVTKDVL